MSSFFDKALADVTSLEEELLGPNYPYYKYVKSPGDLGMSAKGSSIADNIGGLIAYTEVLVTGTGRGTTTGKPLGNKYFLQTGAKCKDTATGNSVTRSLYVNNVPDGTIPFISSMTGESFKEFRGLIPGVLSDMEGLNPLKIFQAFMLGNEPDCRNQTMEIIDSNNIKSKETAFIANADLQGMNACWFSDKKNPLTKAKCKESFSKIETESTDSLIKIYNVSLSLLAFYIFMKLITKNKSI